MKECLVDGVIARIYARLLALTANQPRATNRKTLEAVCEPHLARDGSTTTKDGNRGSQDCLLARYAYPMLLFSGFDCRFPGPAPMGPYDWAANTLQSGPDPLRSSVPRTENFPVSSIPLDDVLDSVGELGDREADWKGRPLTAVHLQPERFSIPPRSSRITLQGHHPLQPTSSRIPFTPDSYCITAFNHHIHTPAILTDICIATSSVFRRVTLQDQRLYLYRTLLSLFL